MRRPYENTDGDKYIVAEQDVKNASFPCSKHGDRGRLEIDHLYGLCCRGWYCYSAQHSLCRIAVPTTPAQTVLWSIPIIFHIIPLSYNILPMMNTQHIWMNILFLSKKLW